MKILNRFKGNKKIKTLFVLFCILIVVSNYAISISNSFSRSCMIVASFCMLGSFLVTLKSFI